MMAMRRKNQWYDASMVRAERTIPSTLPRDAAIARSDSFFRLAVGSGNMCTIMWYADGIATVSHTQ